ncbi:MAG: hypothetical protein ABI183_02465, partial [Polyangiaceae bacterium]
HLDGALDTAVADDHFERFALNCVTRHLLKFSSESRQKEPAENEARELSRHFWRVEPYVPITLLLALQGFRFCTEGGT